MQEGSQEVQMTNAENREEQGNQPNPQGFFADTNNQAACSVRVALRIRPRVSREKYEKQVVRAYEDTSTVTIGAEKMFTYDACFGPESEQEEVFETCVKNLVLGCFQGYNATVLAYGQTGSGKTWTMGSGYTSDVTPEEYGIIPRVIHLIFDEVEKRKSKIAFVVKCSFLEIYNEELHDLLDSGSLHHMGQGEKNSKINIREEKNGQIAVYGLKEEHVLKAEDMAELLDRGSSLRTTASTLMNNNSSRSHAIFTISIEQRQLEEVEDTEDQQVGSGEAKAASDEFMVAKFHFVDLAGSERAKKTGASGATLKEGININKSLLVLGNVISALGEEGKKGNFVPYRDSKLTRILQDSLGGNSRTSMIACCSPAESNFDETLNTLNYASRARKIQNKPKVNRDPNSALIAELRQQCYEYQKECLRFRKLLVQGDVDFKPQLELPSEEEFASLELEAARKPGGDAIRPAASGAREFGMSGKEIRALEDQIKQLKSDNCRQAKEMQSLQVSHEGLKHQLEAQQIDSFDLQQARDTIRTQLDQVNLIMDAFGYREQVYNELHKQLVAQNALQENDAEQQQATPPEKPELPPIIGLDETLAQEYSKQIQELKRDLGGKNLMIGQLQSNADHLEKQSEEDQQIMTKQAQDIEKYKRSTAKLQKENLQAQAGVRNMNKQGMSGKAAGQNLRNTVIGSGGLLEDGGNFQHSFKKSFSMASRQTEVRGLTKKTSTNWIGDDFEEKVKEFNEKFMENLTLSLTKQLGFELTQTREEAETLRKARVGQSFIEKPASSLSAGLKAPAAPLMHAFGPQQPLGKHPGRVAAMSASVVVPGLSADRGGKEDSNKKLKQEDAHEGPMSVIQDCETVNEQDTVQEENLGTDEENAQRDPAAPNKDNEENVSDSNDPRGLNLGQSILSNGEQAALLRRSIALRQSLLKEDQAKRSALNSQIDVEMKDESGGQPPAPGEFNEVAVAVEECSEDDQAELEAETRDVADEELFSHLEQMKTHKQEQNSVIVKFEGDIRAKEDLLAAIKGSQAAMQKDLLDLMKNQYHNKVLELTNEITELEKSKFQDLSKPGAGMSEKERNKLAEQFRSQQKDLERQLRDAKEKNKQQLAVKRQLDLQNGKIKGLESEIQKIKIQKTSAQRKFKEQSDKYNGLRKERADEVLRMKKLALKKDKEIDQLKKDAKRKDLINKRRHEEIKVLQTQKNMVHSKKTGAKTMRQQAQQINTSSIKDWIRQSLDKMIEIRDAEQEIQTQYAKLGEVDNDIESESNHKASLQLLKEKLLVKKYVVEGKPEQDLDLEDLFSIDNELRKIELEIEQYASAIGSLQETQDYVVAKISQVSKEMVEINMEFGLSLGKQNLSSPEGVKALIDCFFQILQEASVQLRQLQVDHEKQISEFDQLREESQEQQRLLEANERYFRAKMQNIENEFSEKEMQLSQLIGEARLEMEENKNTAGGPATQNPHRAMQQRIMAAREEVQMGKDAASNESKLFLSKRVAELEKLYHDGDKHSLNLQNKLNQALSEKEHLRQQISQLKHQLKVTNEMSSDINLRSHIHASYGLGQTQTQTQTAQGASQSRKGVASLADRRADMKQIKNARREHQHELQDPRVFELDDDENEDQLMEGDEGSQHEQPELGSLKHYKSVANLQFSDSKKKIQITSEHSIEQPGRAGYASNRGKDNMQLTRGRGRGGVFRRLTQRKNTAIGAVLRKFGHSKQSEPTLSVPAGALRVRQGSTIQSQRAHRSGSRLGSQGGGDTGYDQLSSGAEESPYRVREQAHSANRDQNQPQESWVVERVMDQAHKEQIYDIEAIGNMLYSTSMKNLKVWDLNTMQLISDIKAHNGVIKQVKAMHTDRNGEITGEKIFVTAGDKHDKTVQIWDMTTLKNVATLKGHRGEIRALEFSKDGKYLFSAGMGGMLVWDIRNTAAPIELIEKQMDIFALKTTASQIFLGCRNHCIVPVGLSYSELFQDQVGQPLKSPHLDVVTSFTTLLDDEILISASKDKNIRGWGTQQEASQDPLFKLPNLQLDQAHSDHINVVRSSHDQQRMFSGSRDGIVNVWSVVGDPADIEQVSLVQIDQLQGQGSPVTAIACLDPSIGNLIIYASMDKSLRVCRRADHADEADPGTAYGQQVHEQQPHRSSHEERSRTALGSHKSTSLL